MSRNSILDSNRQQTVIRCLLINFVATLILAGAQPTLSQTQPKTFASPEQAAQVLYNAVRNDDEKAVEAILGGAELTSSGNDNEDRLERDHFAKKYAEMHRLVHEPDGSTTLYVGAENWPFPIPLIEDKNQWHFDADSGSLEVQARQIGENETSAIEVCRSANKVNPADANQTSANDAVLEFARNLLRAEGSQAATTDAAFHGYYFRILKAKSGETLLVAYPAEYGASGVMTFELVRGAVYEKDLGPQTATVAQKLHGNTGAKWKEVQWADPN